MKFIILGLALVALAACGQVPAAPAPNESLGKALAQLSPGAQTMQITRGSQTFTGDGSTTVFFIPVNQPDGNYLVLHDVLGGLGGSILQGDPTPKGFRVAFSLAPLAIAPPFTVNYAILRTRPATHVVDATLGQTLAAALPLVQPGDTLLLNGTFNESVDFAGSQFDGVTVDGQNTTTIVGPDPTLNVVQADGVRNFTLQNLSISGGRDGVAIDTCELFAINHIQVTAGRHGIHYQRMSSGFVVNSTITGNPQNGLIVNENSYVRVGFTNGIGASEGDPGPNTITSNGGFGIRVQRQSGARIYNNSIASNGNSGVHVESFSYAEVASNDISNNGNSGVFVSENGVVHLGNPTGTKTEDTPNTSITPNTAFGLTAQWGAYAQGRFGGLTGVSGQSSFTHNAQNNVGP